MGKGIEFREYYATACPHCRHLEPIWQKAAASYTGPVQFKSIECADKDWRPVPENSTTCAGIRGFPTMKLFKDGKEVETYDGDRAVDALVKYAKDHEGVVQQAMPPLVAGLALAAPKRECFARAPGSI